MPAPCSMPALGPPPPGSADVETRWPWWFAPLGLVLALSLATVLGTVALVFVELLPGATELHLRRAATLLTQDLAFVAVAVGLGATAGRVLPASYGLRPLGAWRLVPAVALTAVAFYLASVAWTVVVHPAGEQDLLDKLGAGRDPIHLAIVGVLVIVLAPLAEELLFRGFMYRALRNSVSAPAAIAVIAVTFSSLHYGGPDTLGSLPLLALLGALLCLLVERTGSLWPAVALHAVNNAIAVAADLGSKQAAATAVLLATMTLAGCSAATRRTPAAAPARA